MKHLQATAIVARNSLAYVAHVFASGEARRTPGQHCQDAQPRQ